MYGGGGEEEEKQRRERKNVGGSRGGSRRGEGVVTRKITKMPLSFSFFLFLFQVTKELVPVA